MFWVHFPEAREVLINAEVFNLVKNDADDAVYMRAQVYDFKLQDTEKAGFFDVAIAIYDFINKHFNSKTSPR